jgi:acetylornithine aminotransferase
VARALCDQAGKLVHTSNLYGIELQEQLATEICALSGLDNVFFAIPAPRRMKPRCKYRV